MNAPGAVHRPLEFKVPFSGKSRNYSAEEIQVVVEAMQTADPQTQGRHQAEFQQAFSDFNQVPYSFAVTNATAAIELSALLSRVGPGDEVIVPAHTFAATAIPFARTGAKIVWADIDPETWTVSPKSIESLITASTKVIVVVHLYGLTADMDPIVALAVRNGVAIVEDCAQSLGAEYKGRKSGAFGDFGCFSFHTHKNITTLGEGGMLTLRDPELAALAPGLRHNGLRSYGPRESYWKPAMSLVDFDIDGLWPYNLCLGEIQCALGTELIKKIDTINQFRTNRALRFKDALEDFPELVFQRIPADCKSASHLLPARYDPVRPGVTRDDVISRMAYAFGIQLVVQYYPLFRYPMFQKAGFGKAECPETERFFDNMVSFPFHEWLSDSDFAYVVESTKSVLTQLRK